MATIYKNARGSRTIQFTDGDRKRRTICLGGLNAKAASAVKAKVEALLAAKVAQTSWDRETAEWVRKLEPRLYDKLAKVGLVPPRATAECDSFAAFMDAYIKSRRDARPNTIRNFKSSRDRLVRFFGQSCSLRDITAGRADEWRQDLVNSGLAEATISKAVKHARHFAKLAVRKGLITANPFADLRAGGERNSSRLHFVPRETVFRVIEAAPDAQWRLIIALARFGGLRTPSETLALTWADVNWADSRVAVPAIKTARTAKPFRMVPLFPELRPFLEAVFEEAEPGEQHVITRYRVTNTNLRTQLLRILKQAGVEPWERIFHNMRASRQTELADQHPIHVVADWLGNSPAIAERHYLKTTDEHFRRAATEPTGALQNALQHQAAGGGIETQPPKPAQQKPLVLQGLASRCSTASNAAIPRRGVEPLSPP